eukprot:TRINITY_DN18636_c0_g1_i1.p1 TRINITY_DN18636_c0_g1~~TRINITY_DN18636_c0_g1_i1.p1  ORF type:complete len:178 (-),score=24.39 TRINITY_DN18636_c0_g1_i1:6-539(-)
MSFAAHLKQTSQAAKVNFEAHVDAKMEQFTLEQLDRLKAHCQWRAAKGYQDAHMDTSRIDLTKFFEPGVSGNARSAIQAITRNFEAKLQCLGVTTVKLAPRPAVGNWNCYWEIEVSWSESKSQEGAAGYCSSKAPNGTRVECPVCSQHAPSRRPRALRPCCLPRLQQKAWWKLPLLS